MIGGYSPWFIEELKRRVEAYRCECSDEVISGGAADFAHYRYAVGFNDGLKQTLIIADEIKQEQDRA